MLEAKKVSVGREKTSAKTPGGLQPLLTIMTEPLGAEVKLNGKVLGITTAYGLSVPWKPGTSMEIGKPGYQTETLNFDVPFQETEITVQLQSALRLCTNPWGASVLVDGKPFGATTREGLVVPWHGCKIEILKNGYTSQILKFDSPPSEPETSVELQPVFSTALTVPKHHWMEIAGYLLGGIALMFLPVVFFIGIRGGSNLSQESYQLRQEISRLSFVLSGKDQDNQAVRETNVQRAQDVRNLQDRVKQIGLEKEEMTRKILVLDADFRSVNSRLVERDIEVQSLKKDSQKYDSEKQQKEDELRAIQVQLQKALEKTAAAERDRSSLQSQLSKTQQDKDKEITDLKVELRSERGRLQQTDQRAIELQRDKGKLEDEVKKLTSAAAQKQIQSPGYLPGWPKTGQQSQEREPSRPHTPGWLPGWPK
jgi:hypothetical protein